MQVTGINWNNKKKMIKYFFDILKTIFKSFISW